jgi:coiled-coil and C2 domain-containing protein 2A
LLYDASTGKTYDASDPTVPLISIGSLISTENIYANIQNFDAPSLMAYDVDNSRNWRPFFTEKKYPKPELTTCQELDLEYSPPDEEKAQLLEREILETVQTELRTWRENEVGARRGAVTTRLARNTGNALKTTLEEFEKALRGEMEFDENAYRSKLKTTPNLQGLFENKSLHGFPINCPFTDMKSIVEKVRDTNIHCNEAKDVKFACAVKVFPYPNEIFSVWVFLLSECAKQNRV